MISARGTYTNNVDIAAGKQFCFVFKRVCAVAVRKLFGGVENDVAYADKICLTDTFVNRIRVEICDNSSADNSKSKLFLHIFSSLLGKNTVFFLHFTKNTRVCQQLPKLLSSL